MWWEILIWTFFSINHHVPTQEFIDSLFSHAFFPLISKPTRLTSEQLQNTGPLSLEKFNETHSNTNRYLFIKEDDSNEAYNDFISEFSRTWIS